MKNQHEAITCDPARACSWQGQEAFQIEQGLLPPQFHKLGSAWTPLSRGRPPTPPPHSHLPSPPVSEAFPFSTLGAHTIRRHLSLPVCLSLNREGRDFPGGPLVKSPRSQCRGSGFNPWSGDQIPHVATKNPVCHN